MAATKSSKPASRARSRTSSNGASKALVRHAPGRVGKLARVAMEVTPVLRQGGQIAVGVAHRIREAVDGGLPLQASVDIAMPISTVYDEWLELEWLPGTGDEDVEITEEREDERIAWAAEEVEALATFHLLDDRLTRVELLVNGTRSGPLARRRADQELRRIKAYMELEVEEETGE